MRVLVTGARGFVGSHLIRHLRSRGHSVVLVDRHSGPDPEFGIDVHAIELPDRPAIERLLDDERPDGIIHLAGISSVPVCEENPELAERVNVRGTRELAEVWAERGGPGPFIFVSSVVVYGPTPVAEQPVDEETEPRPAHRYGATKLAAERCLPAALGDRRFVVFRPFNHFGPGQSDDFVIASFARQAAAISLGLQPPVVHVGNLSVQRDFLDVRDVVEAYGLALESEVGGTFVLASGQAVALESILDRLRDSSGVDFRIEVDPARVRKKDLPVLVGSSARYRAATGWRPKHSLDESLRLVYDDWSQRLR